ncbi:ribosome maturation factor RimM [Zoogloea sp.]|jgi:16S rRNA processing protein RimM|uniref:ribosome maturation factor RimM n=1 Tax=Zoogloea sp. TaxID=49181 RepID=UPI0011D59933|nr:ribosome maturation factor RimM [Zoogloea sp.]MBK6653646.1 ribosome maturation factor RimM [Zoogloea sp.]MBK7848695.1 ribosome maturation factor RimM [Zoogloea sp.]MBP7444461.1 ribosome maturation factor RimM [Zoogloea sp.]TXG95512.1 MAG: ribosome maturation factor RimM [Zoogloea sp.]HOY00886.1 ribosome maturation factor RimM [Zoogloea sp.]
MIILGRIVAPFGVGGWVKVHPFGDDPLSWKKIPQWWLATDPDGKEWVPFTLKGCREHGKGGIVASFDEVPDRNGAEAVTGYFVAAPREALPKPEKDEYYWADLVGLEVTNAAGMRFGKVEGLLSTGAHDVLQVRDGDVERLIPFVAAYVLSVDTLAGQIQVDWEADW